MLDADEGDLPVRRPGQAGHLGAVRSCEEAGDFTGLGIAHQHLVVALPLELAFIAVVAIGLDPQHPVGRESHAIGRVEHVAFVDVV